VWLRRVRNANVFYGYWATDNNGTPGTWNPLGPLDAQGNPIGHTIPLMGKDVYVGLGLSAHANGLTATATFDHVQVVSGFATRTQDPVAILTPSANGQASSILSKNKVDVT